VLLIVGFDLRHETAARLSHDEIVEHIAGDDLVDDRRGAEAQQRDADERGSEFAREVEFQLRMLLAKEKVGSGLRALLGEDDTASLATGAREAPRGWHCGATTAGDRDLGRTRL